MKLSAAPCVEERQARQPEALLLALDVRAASADSFEQLRDAAVRLARTRLVYSERDDLISVLRCGTDSASNDFNDDNQHAYKNISVVVPLVSSSLRAVAALKLSQPHNSRFNFFDLLDVGGHYLTSAAAKRGRRHRLVLFTDGECMYHSLTDDDVQDFKSLCAHYAHNALRVDVIYHCSEPQQQRIAHLEHAFPDLSSLPVRDVIQHCGSTELAVFYIITTFTKGMLLSYQHASPLVDTPTAKIKRATAKFKGVLNLANTLKIPVKRYNHVQPAKHPPSSKISWNASLANRRPVPVHVETQRVASANDDAPLSEHSITHAFPYGPQLVPETNHVDSMAWHMRREKGLDVIGFVPAHSLSPNVFLNSVDVLVPMTGSEPSERLMRALVLALSAEKMGILARSVMFAKGGPPALAYMWPCVEVDRKSSTLKNCFLYIVDVPMKEDVRYLPFASLDDVYQNVDQSATDAMDRLISAANLDLDSTQHAMLDEEEEEEQDPPFWPTEQCNPNLAWFHMCIVHRAIDGEKGTDFPPLSQWQCNLMDPMQFIKQANRKEFDKSLEDLKKALPVRPAPKREKRSRPMLQAVTGDQAALQNYLPKDETVEQNAEDTQQQQSEEEQDEADEVDQAPHPHTLRSMDDAATQITELGVVDVSEEKPESDFANLVKNGQFRFASLSIMVVIRRLIRDASDEDKAMRCLKALRKAALAQNDPRLFNDFVVELVRRCDRDDSTGNRTRAFFRYVALHDQIQYTLDVIPAASQPKEPGSTAAHLNYMSYLQEISSRIKQLTRTEQKTEPSLSVVSSSARKD
ncbi:ATP-dependent DNA helicase 2 subunit KU80 [Gracilariopsis chorda]|uniref:ATP-dependent DNA helicase 2 subunit KU80 n=1 Tax=Gracilariopsis chorda TaxID=448386 RepID=A0A2V3IL10_9FLOR|nr:ATP-dependent DNA helicase 2 subunit KU80 [Gracilariopsis chorda]|eukprot:PXF42771.1 ATP-dependent DNA helicase 2 subunit KU80 [Gracilariopsis chorda]